MKITVKAKALASGLSFVGRAAARQGSPAPHLTSVLFEADEETGLTTMRATDAEIAASLTSRAPEVGEGGRAALPARTLTSLVSSVDPDKNVVLEADENEAALAFEGTGNHYSLRPAKAGEFPPLPEFPSEDGHSFPLKARTLAEAIRRVGPAASKDDSRPVLTGLLFSFEPEGKPEGKPDEASRGVDDGATTSNENASNASNASTVLSVVATDSYRMAVARDRSDRIAHPAGSAVIPARALKEAARLCSMGPEHIDVALTRNTAFFRVGGVMLSTRLIAGSFPEYRKLLPEGGAFEHEFSVDAGELLEVLHRVNLFAARQSPPVPVRLAFSAPEDLLTVSVESEAGSAVEGVRAKALASDGKNGRSPGETDEGSRQPEEGNGLDSGIADRGIASEDFEILFNPHYLMDAVKSCADAGGGAVVFRMEAPLKPAVLSPAQETPDSRTDEEGRESESSEASLRCLIMPMADPRRKGASS